MWPVFAARTAATTAVLGVALVLVLRHRAARLPQGRTITLAVAAGLLDVGATAMLVLAVRRGLIVLVAPIASLARVSPFCSHGSCSASSSGASSASGCCARSQDSFSCRRDDPSTVRAPRGLTASVEHLFEHRAQARQLFGGAPRVGARPRSP
jgi:hypothetical protein